MDKWRTSHKQPTTLNLTPSRLFFLAIMNAHYVSDIETEALIIALSLTDIEDVEESRKGKLREDAALTDEEVAFNIQAETLKMFLATLQDQRFALSIDEALQADTAALSAFSTINQGELDDHIAALALERGHDLPFPTRSQRLLECTNVPSLVDLIYGFRCY
jgi:hypothetical protein